MPYVTLLETSANQAYIFASNRQREQVGASELLWRSTTRWLAESMPVDVRDRLGPTNGDQAWWLHLDDAQRNVPLVRGGDLEVVVAVSGKALFLAHDPAVAASVVGAVTQRALEEAPGLTLLGATVAYGPDAAGGRTSLSEAVSLAHRQIDEVRAAVPPPALRMLHDPLTAVCRTSGAPSGTLQRLPDGDGLEPRGRQVAAAQRAGERGLARLSGLLAAQVEAGRVMLPKLAKKSDAMRRVAVVHADGNGFGQLFLSLGRIVADDASVQDADQRFIELYRSLSVGLDEVTHAALLAALTELPDASQRAAQAAEGGEPTQPPAILPLVLGGDDLTALIDAEVAWPVVTAFLGHFERLANRHPGIARVIDALAGHEGRRPWLSAAAGIAVVPRAYPFHSAYGLAEQAAASAKRAKVIAALDGGGCPSSVDVHVHYDPTGSDLDLIRARRRGGVDDATIDLVGGPYLLLNDDALASFPEHGTPEGVWPRTDLAARTVGRMDQWLSWVGRCMHGPGEEDQETSGESELRPDGDAADTLPAGISRTALARLREGLTGGVSVMDATRVLLRPEHADRLAEMEARHGRVVTKRTEGRPREGAPPSRSSLLLDAIDLVAVAQIAADREER